jgi:hypothetical protein
MHCRCYIEEICCILNFIICNVNHITYTKSKELYALMIMLRRRAGDRRSFCSHWLGWLER